MLMFWNARSPACFTKQQIRRRKNVLEDHCPGSESHQKAEIPLSSKGSGSSPTRTIHWSKKRWHGEQKSPSQQSVALLARNLSANESKWRRSNVSLTLWLPKAETEPKDLQNWMQVRKQNLFWLFAFVTGAEMNRRTTSEVKDRISGLGAQNFSLFMMKKELLKSNVDVSERMISRVLREAAE